MKMLFVVLTLVAGMAGQDQAAIQRTRDIEDSSNWCNTCKDGWCTAMNCGPHKVKETYWDCSDPSAALMTSVDGKKHWCITQHKFEPGTSVQPSCPAQGCQGCRVCDVFENCMPCEAKPSQIGSVNNSRILHPPVCVLGSAGTTNGMAWSCEAKPSQEGSDAHETISKRERPAPIGGPAEPSKQRAGDGCPHCSSNGPGHVEPLNQKFKAQPATGIEVMPNAIYDGLPMPEMFRYKISAVKGAAHPQNADDEDWVREWGKL